MKVLVTGGAGFIGCNLARALASLGHRVVVVDNLSRSGSERNLRALLERGSAAELVTFRSVDVRDGASMAAILVEPGDPYDAVVHLAGQTTVTESVTDPVQDFDVNAGGTLTVLEAVRAHAPAAHVLFASTNKVYGDLRSLRLERTATRYVLPEHPDGIAESFPTNAASPYGCSKLGPEFALSVWAEFGPLLEDLVGRPIPIVSKSGVWRIRMYSSAIIASFLLPWAGSHDGRREMGLETWWNGWPAR